MNFKPELVEKILAGEKTQTRRFTAPNPRSPWYEGGCALKVGSDYALCPGRGKHQVARIRVTEVRRELTDDVGELEARAEGFLSLQAFMEYWERLHGKFELGVPVWVISFELVREPVAYRVVDTIEHAHRLPIHHDYPLLPGDILGRDHTGTFTKVAPGLGICGFRLTASQIARLEPLDEVPPFEIVGIGSYMAGAEAA